MQQYWVLFYFTSQCLVILAQSFLVALAFHISPTVEVFIHLQLKWYLSRQYFWSQYLNIFLLEIVITA